MKKGLAKLYYANQLWLDLVNDIAPRKKNRGRKKGSKNRPHQGRDFYFWSQNDLEKMVDGFFISSLRTLMNAETTIKNKQDVYDWVFVPLVNVYQGQQPETLSFQFCCKWLGYEPDEVQERITNVLVRDGLINGLRTQTNQALAA